MFNKRNELRQQCSTVVFGLATTYVRLNDFALPFTASKHEGTGDRKR